MFYAYLSLSVRRVLCYCGCQTALNGIQHFHSIPTGYLIFSTVYRILGLRKLGAVQSFSNHRQLLSTAGAWVHSSSRRASQLNAKQYYITYLPALFYVRYLKFGEFVSTHSLTVWPIFITVQNFPFEDESFMISQKSLTLWNRNISDFLIIFQAW